MTKNLKIKVIGVIENEKVFIQIPLWYFQVISNYEIINSNNKIFGKRKNGICLIKNGI